MMKMKNLLVTLALSVFAATSLASSGLTGQVAPDFALKSSSGDNLRLSEYRGDVVMVNFSRKAMRMVSELGVSFPVLFDDRKEVSKLYEVEAMPVTVLIDEV